MASYVYVSFAVFRFGANDGLVRVHFYRVLVRVGVMSFLLRRLEVHRLEDRVTVVHRRRRADDVAIRASCQVSAFTADSFRGVRCDGAHLEVVEDDRAVFQLVRRRVRLAFGTCHFVVRLRSVDAFSLDARFHCRFAVRQGGTNYSGFVNFAA